MRILTQIVAWEPLQHVSKPLLTFHNSLASLSQTGALPTTRIHVASDNSEAQASRAMKKHRAQDRKQQLAQEAQCILSQLANEGWTIAFTDGSAKHHPKIGWVAGYGCVVMHGWETFGFSTPLLPKLTIGQSYKQLPVF